MTKTCLVTGISGTDVDTLLENEREVFIEERITAKRRELKEKGVEEKELREELALERSRAEKAVTIYHMGTEMANHSHKLNLGYDFRYILQLPERQLNMLVERACTQIKEHLEKEKPDVAFIRTHASFYDPQHQNFTDGIFAKDFEGTSIDRVCCIIDDEIVVGKRLKSHPTYKNIPLTNELLLHWISNEVERTDRFFEQLGIKRHGTDRSQVFSRYMSTTSLYKFVNFDDCPVIYAIYPMTAVEGNKKVEAEVDKLIWILNRYGIVKNPKAGDVGQIDGEPILANVEKHKADREDYMRFTHVVNRDINYLVLKSDIVVGNIPIDTYSDGMIVEMWEGMKNTKLVILKVGRNTKQYSSPFRIFQARSIHRSRDGIENALQEEGYEPKYLDLMSRWKKEYHDVRR